MGFRDIQAFNLALLAKQAWRLIHNTHSLFYRVYKSRYFPNCSLMDANLGNNPLYVWWNSLEARDIIKEGSIWKVGDGKSIEISTHKWLSHKPIFRGDPWRNMLVSDLIDANTRRWDREKIFDLFAFRTRMEIMAIPLLTSETHDTLVWKENRSMQFLVKSAYHVSLRKNEQE